MFRKLVIAFAAVAAMASSAEAINLGAARSFKPQVSRPQGAAPAGYQMFCVRFKSECQGGGRSTVAYTSATASLLRRVNDAVNRSIRYRPDKGEVWKIGGSAGDCEDFALAKRSRLIRAGIPAGALRIATARTRKGEMHAVLVVKTDSGDYVLDNIRKTVVMRNQTGYRFLRIATSNPRVWQSARSGGEI